jgi:hypothetical protein
VRLEGTLDAFSLPDIFQLLSYTKKTGTLHLHRQDRHGVVHLRDGAVTGARSDVTRQELGRRLVGSGLVDDEALASAAEQIAEEPGSGLARLLAEKASLDAALVAGLAAEQATDAVFDLLRWPDGEFSFFVDEADPDDLGARLPLEAVVEEGRRRLQLWGSLVESVPAPDAVLRLHPAPPADPAVSRDEWALLALVDGHRTVADLVALAGRGEYAVVSALAALVARGLLASAGPADDQFQRRQALLAALEGRPVAVPELTAPEPSVPGLTAPEPTVPGLTAPEPTVPGLTAPAPDAASSPSAPGPVVPQRREPFTPARRPEHAEQPLAHARPGEATASAAHVGFGAPGSVDGANALAPTPGTSPSPVLALDSTVNKTLLLRLIAGVRGL